MATIKGHYDGTGIVLDEPAALAVGQAVVIVAEPPAKPPSAARPSLAGFAKGWFVVRDDFDDPLDEFAEYM